MDVPYACSEDSNGLTQPSCNQSHGEAEYYSSHMLVFNTPNPYEETDISGDSCKNFKISWADPPVEIHEECTTDIDLPLLMWHGYDVPPKVLSVCNTGRTITVNGQWTNGRPHIEGGPLNGKYIFSQIHFHCPSEHEIDGRRYPMEMHVVHYKASYLTQERAMHEKDGTLVLSYLFQVVEAEETILSEITKTRECLKEINSRIEITRIPLCELVTPFYCNYYVYWGSVTMKKNSFILQWIINCNQSQVTKEEVCIRGGRRRTPRRVDTLLCVMNTCAVMMGQGPKMRPQNSLIYRVGENYDIRTPTQTTETCTSAHSVYEQDLATAQESVCQNAGPCCNLQQNSPCLNCYARSAEGVCSSTQPHGTCQSETQNLCCTCGGIPAPPPSHPCQCKPNYQKVCKSCGGSRSRIVWCKQKWDKCKSKCSVQSKISSCSCSEKRCKKCLRKRKCIRKKCRSKTSSCTSCSDKSDPENVSLRRSSSAVCSERKSPIRTCPAEKTTCAVKKLTVEENPPENSCQLLPPEEPLEKCTDATLDDSCEVPNEKVSSTSCSCIISSTPGTSTSDVCRRMKERRKPKKRCKKMTCNRHKHKVNPKKENCDDQNDENVEQKKEAKKKGAKEDNNESKESSKNGKSESGEKSKNGKKAKGKDSEETSEKSSEKGGKKTKKQKDDEVTTLFLKMPETLFPRDNTNALSCSDSGLDEKKNTEGEESTFVNQESYVVKKVTRTEGEETGLPWSELCFQMKHSFQVKKTDSFCLPQEYQVSLVCDNNVLQEYRGQFQPQDISLDSIEELPLAPKYLNPDESKVRLEECVIKKLSTDKFCIDSKFLLRSWNPQNAILNTEKDTANHYSEKILNSFFDAETQCSVEELELNEIPLTDVKSESVQTKESDLPVNDKVKKIFCKKLDVKSQTVQTEPRRDVEKEKKELLSHRAKILKTISTPELSALLEKRHRDEPVNFPERKPSHLETPVEEKNSGQSTEKLECKIKLIKNPKKSMESSEASSSSQVLEKKEMEKLSSDAPKRHTVYFMYDRIEKDPSTGKKIFMGKFRTKDDLRILREHSITSRTNSSRSFGSQGVTDKTSSAESRSIGMDKLEEFPQRKSGTPERQKPIKQMSAHKFHPKCLELTQFKALNSNPVLAKVVNWFQYDGENFEILAGILGLDQKFKSKLFGERKAGEKAEEPSFSAKGKDRRREACQDKATMCSCHSLRPGNVPNSVGLKSADSDSVIIVPVEVESWSKIEVVLIEHSDDKQSIKMSKKYVPLL